MGVTPQDKGITIGFDCQFDIHSIIHHQLLDERVFCGFGTHSVRSRAGYPLKNATANLRFPKFAETPCNVSVSKHTSTIGRKMMPQKSTATFTQLQ